MDTSHDHITPARTYTCGVKTVFHLIIIKHSAAIISQLPEAICVLSVDLSIG